MQRGRDEATDSRAIAGRLLRRLGNISRMLLLVDSRRDILESDLQALSWFLSMGLPVSVVITKSDKLNRQEQSRIKMDWMAALSRNPGVDLTPILVSSKNGDGMDLLSAKVSESLYGSPS
jgi:GTP-binding protein